MNKTWKFLIVFLLAALVIPSALRVSAADLSALSLTRDEVAAALQDPDAYTDASFAAFSDAVDALGGLAGIDAVIAENTATQMAVDQLEEDLRSALALLVRQETMDALIEANNLAITAYYQDREFYTRSSHSGFRAAVGAYGGYLTVNALIADPGATPEEVEAAEAAIRSALGLLVLRADTAILETAFAQAAALDLTPYIPVSVTAYETELERIRLIMISEDTGQTEADQALADLGSASTILIPFANKTDLSAFLLEVGAIREEKFTVTSFRVFSAKMAEARTLVDDPNALQADVDQALADLQAAFDGLVLFPGEIELTVGKAGFDVDDYVTPGDSAVTGYASSDPAVATVDVSGNVVPLGFGSAEITVSLADGTQEIISVFVKEKVKGLTLMLLTGVPLISAGLAAGLILYRGRREQMPRAPKERVPKSPKPRKIKSRPAGTERPASSGKEA